MNGQMEREEAPKMKPRVFVFLAVASLLISQPVMCCSCVETTLKEMLESSDAVFVGKVIRLEDFGFDTIRVVLQPLRVVKGLSPKEIELVELSHCCFCGVGFDIGETYLVFASLYEGNLVTSTCNRSGKLRDVTEDLKALGLEGFVTDHRNGGARQVGG
jgi:hypothetical protein